MKNYAKEITDKINTLKAEKATELEKIHAHIVECQDKQDIAETALKDATERTDLEAYAKADTDIKSAKTALKMYRERYRQLDEREFISEPESDTIITNLIEYEKSLGEELTEAIAEPLRKLCDIYEKYVESIRETETVIKVWETEIHANYHSPGTIYADGTDRAPTAMPVHPLYFDHYFTSDAKRLGEYLKKASDR